MAPKRSSAVAAMAAAAVMTALSTGASTAAVGRGIDLCQSYSRVCMDFTSQMDCRSRFDRQTSKPMLDVRSCTGDSYETFVGHCRCAALDASSAVLQELVDYSVTPALPALVEPNKAMPNATDYGATYVKACSVFLSGAHCPANLQVVAGYGGKGGLKDFKGSCTCGALDVSEAIRDNLNAYLIGQKIRENTVPVLVNTTVNGRTFSAPSPGGELDICKTFVGVCTSFLDDVDCPAALRRKAGCSSIGGPETLVGACRCGSLDASESVKMALLGLTLPAATVQKARVRREMESVKLASPPLTGEPRVEFCQTYANTCAEFLTAAGIEPKLHEAESHCVGGNGTNLATFSGYCGAGVLNVSRALTSFLVSESVGEVDDLLCLGDSCSSHKLSHGVIAIIGVSTALVASLILLFAYQRRGKTTAKKAAPAVDSQV